MQQFHGSDEYIAQGRTGHWKDDARGGDCQIPRYGTFDLEY